MASQLALLLDTARDFARASHYFQVAGQNAARVVAHQEAVTLARRGLELLLTQPDSPERARQELTLQVTKAASLSAISGHALPEVEETYNRALDLCHQLGENVQLFHVLSGIFILRTSSNYALT